MLTFKGMVLILSQSLRKTFPGCKTNKRVREDFHLKRAKKIIIKFLSKVNVLKVKLLKVNALRKGRSGAFI